MSKKILDNLTLPSLSFISEGGANYIRTISKLSEASYDSIKNFTLRYGSSEREAVDIFVPKKINRPLPVLIFIHGGYWLNGAREMVGYMAPAITNTQMIFCSVGYRFFPDFDISTSLSDCKNGIKKIYEFITSYGGDKTRLIISGHSAGGHLASFLLLKKQLTGIIPDEHIKLCAPVSGVFNIQAIPKQVKNFFGNNDIEHVNMSPLYLDVSTNSIPFLLTIGGSDFGNILRDNELMLAKMKYYSCRVDCLVENDQSHFNIALLISKYGSNWIKAIRAYV